MVPREGFAEQADGQYRGKDRHQVNEYAGSAGSDQINAAQVAGKNRTDFVLEAARRAAEDALLDRTVFTVSPKAYAEFLARLDAPPQPNERLRRTMRKRAPWDRT